MDINPPNLRPDLAPKVQLPRDKRPGQPTIGMVSLGCPKALVKSKRSLANFIKRNFAAGKLPVQLGPVVWQNSCSIVLDLPAPGRTHQGGAS